MMSHRDGGSNRKKKNNTDGKNGNLYKAKNAGGDVKRKGKQDPYSYLPLRKDMLNKRYSRFRLRGQGIKNHF